MGWFLKCVKGHYFDFNRRARRREYWMFTLVSIIISVVLGVMFGPISEKLLPIASLHSLTVLLPALNVAARRLHNIDKSGWWMLIVLVPIVGLYLIYLLAKDDDVGRNQYDQNPKDTARFLPAGPYGLAFFLSLFPFPPLIGVRMPRSHSSALCQRP